MKSHSLCIHGDRINLISYFLASDLNIITGLQVNPELRTIAKVAAQSDSGVSSNAAHTFNNLVNTSGRHMYFFARRYWVISYSSINSARCSPGCIGAILVIFIP